MSDEGRKRSKITSFGHDRSKIDRQRKKLVLTLGGVLKEGGQLEACSTKRYITWTLAGKASPGRASDQLIP
jgi:hypothetical protein